MMTPETIAALKEYVIVVDDIIPEELRVRILKEYSAAAEWLPAAVVANRSTNVRTCAFLGMSVPEVHNVNPERKALDTAMIACASKAARAYIHKFPKLVVQQDSGYDLLRYESTQKYGEHVDTFVTNPRSLSCSFALNDDYEGGEWAMFEGNLKFRAPAGAAVLFPSNFMFPHEILPVTAGTRYSIVTWFT